jgi:Ulp1 family protease
VEIKLSSQHEDEVVIYHYDALCGRQITSSEEIQRYKTYAKEFLLKDCNCTLDEIKFQLRVPDTRPSQKNGCDCGVFVCIVADLLCGVLNVPLSDIDQAFITERNCRASICASILTGEMVPPLAVNKSKCL